MRNGLLGCGTGNFKRLPKLLLERRAIIARRFAQNASTTSNKVLAILLSQPTAEREEESEAETKFSRPEFRLDPKQAAVWGNEYLSYLPRRTVFAAPKLS
jgi:hypothetical protein